MGSALNRLPLRPLEGWFSLSPLEGWFSLSPLEGWFSLSPLEGWFSLSPLVALSRQSCEPLTDGRVVT